MPRIEIDLMGALAVLLEERSVTRAARRLRLSQPAMSAQLARLRAMLGDPLLVPAGRGLVPTPRAEAMLPPLRAAIEELRRLSVPTPAFDPATARRIFRIAGSDAQHMAFSVPLAIALRTAAPGLRLALLNFDRGQIVEQLRRDEVQLVIASETMPASEEIIRRTVLRLGFIFVQRHGHPRGPTPPSLAEFCALEHVLVSPEGGGFSGVVDAALQARGLSRTVVASLPSFLLAAGLVAASDMVAVVPGRVAEMEAHRLHAMPAPLPLDEFALQLAWHPRHQSDGAHAWLRERLVALAATA